MRGRPRRREHLVDPRLLVSLELLVTVDAARVHAAWQPRASDVLPACDDTPPLLVTLEADAQLLERNQLTAHVTFGAPRLRVLGAEDARQVREVIESVALLLLLLRLLRACACARLRGCRLWRNASSA